MGCRKRLLDNGSRRAADFAGCPEPESVWWRRSETDPPAALKLTHPHSGGGCRTTPSGLPQEDAADGRGGDDPALGAGRGVDDPARGPRAAGIAQYDPAVLGRPRARPTQTGRPGPAPARPPAGPGR